MIKIFGQADKDFSSNGDMVIQPLKAKIHKEDNGDYYLSLTAGLKYIDYLAGGNIIVANTPQGDQAFRISNPQKTKSKIEVKAWHISYDSKNYLIEDCDVTDKTAGQALYLFNSATEPQSPFQTFSDIVAINSHRVIRESLYNAFGAVLEGWGGHLVRDNFRIGVVSTIGQDNGITVQYKKNLKDISCVEDWDDVITKILPVGKDGIMLNALDQSASIYVESTVQYGNPYCKSVTFSQDGIKQEDYSSETAYKQALVDNLRSQAEYYVEANCVPLVNYTLKANVEKITDIGDVIRVKDERLGIDLLTNVISFDYDCILEKYVEIEFGNFKPTLSGLVSNITASVDKSLTEQMSSVTANIQKELSYTIYPVGSIYISANDVDPSLVFGGIWERIKDRFLLACGDTYANGTAGGESSVILTTDQMPVHSHDIEYTTNGTTYVTGKLAKAGSTSDMASIAGTQSIDSGYQARIKKSGGGEAHNNMPPYLAVYMWKRIA